MKYLKKIDELYKSTYLNAAKKMSRNHSGRADKIEDYGKQKGIPQPVDRISAHRFLIRFSPSDYVERHDNEYFSLVKTYSKSKMDFKEKMYNYIGFDFISNYNRKHTLYLGYIPNAAAAKELEVDNQRYNPKRDDNEYDGIIVWMNDHKPQYYRFKDRKDAVELKKAAIEFLEENKVDKYGHPDPSQVLQSYGYDPFWGDEECGYCGGTGQVNCPQCDEHGISTECDMCMGDGFASCPECEGEGQFEGGGEITGYYDENGDICELEDGEYAEMCRDFLENSYKEEISRLKKMVINSLYTSDSYDMKRREEAKAAKAKANPAPVGFGAFMSKSKRR